MTHHTPVRALYDPHLIGYQCMHCRVLFTASMNPSQETIVRTGKRAKVFDNKRHARRVKAAAK